MALVTADTHRAEPFAWLSYLNQIGPVPTENNTLAYGDMVDNVNHWALKYEGTNLYTSSGIVTTITVLSEAYNSDGSRDALITITGKWKLSDIPVTEINIPNLANEIFKGNDTFKATDGDDFIFSYAGKDKLSGGVGVDYFDGGKGNDRMTGGDGVDTFFFAKGNGKDVITDFDAKGGEGNQDFIEVRGGTMFDIEKHGHDTIIDFGKGSTITLLDVKASQLTQADFHFLWQ